MRSTKCARECSDHQVVGHKKILKQLRLSDHFWQFIRFQSFISIHSCSFQVLRFNSLISILFQFSHFSSFVSIHSFSSIHSQLINFKSCILIYSFNSFMSIHSFIHSLSQSVIHSVIQFFYFTCSMSTPSCQFFHVNSFISIHSFQFLHLDSFHFIHVNSFISCTSFHFNSLLSNSPKIATNHVPFSKLPLRRVPTTGS